MLHATGDATIEDAASPASARPAPARPAAAPGPEPAPERATGARRGGRLRRYLADLPIRVKIAGAIVSSTFLSLAIGFALVIWTSIRSFEADLIRDAAFVADVVGSYNAINLQFDDKEGAAHDLDQLRSRPEIKDTYIFDNDKNLFQPYTRSGELVIPERIYDSYHELRDGYLHYFSPITFEGRKYGTIYLRMSTEELHREIREYLTYMGLVALGLVVAAILLAYLLQGFISRPILQLAERAQFVTEEGDYSIRVEKPGADEIGVLYDTFNEMLAQIERRQEELERSNRDLDQFAYVASHDLKAPLRAIATLSGWLEQDLAERLDDEQKDQMRLLRSRVRRMDALIEGILEYSRVGRADRSGQPVDVGALLGDLVDLIAPPPGMEIHIARDMPTLVASKLRLEQVFSNLLTNAIKYHERPDGRIDVTCRRLDDGMYEFAVADDGPGIAPEHQEKVFWMFQTLQPRDKVESTGVGLALVKKLVEEEGGRVTLESAPGTGATFRFTWPAVPRPAAGHAAPVAARERAAEGGARP